MALRRPEFIHNVQPQPCHYQAVDASYQGRKPKSLNPKIQDKAHNDRPNHANRDSKKFEAHDG